MRRESEFLRLRGIPRRRQLPGEELDLDREGGRLRRGRRSVLVPHLRRGSSLRRMRKTLSPAAGLAEIRVLSGGREHVLFTDWEGVTGEVERSFQDFCCSDIVSFYCVDLHGTVVERNYNLNLELGEVTERRFVSKSFVSRGRSLQTTNIDSCSVSSLRLYSTYSKISRKEREKNEKGFDSHPCNPECFFGL